MSRIRSIKPDFWSSEQVMALPRDARLLFIGLWNFADDAGRFRWSPRSIKAQVLPGDDDATTDVVGGWLSLIAHYGLIERYVNDHGEHFGFISGWKHQRINRPQPSKYPDPKDCKPFTECAVNAHGALIPDPLGSSGIHWEGGAGGDGAAAPTAPAAPPAPKPSATRKPPAAQQALGAALKRSMPVPPQLSRSLREKAAKRLTDAVAAGVAPDLDAAADILVAAWQKLGTDNAWKLCDVPIRRPSDPGNQPGSPKTVFGDPTPW